MNLKHLFRHGKNDKVQSDRRRYRPSVSADGLERRDLMATANITPGSVVKGTISSTNRTDEWKFSGNSGNVINLIAHDTNKTDKFFVNMEVISPSGKIVGGFNDGEQRTVTLEEGGTYTLRLKDYQNQNSGTYHLGLELLKPNNTSKNSLKIGGIVNGVTEGPLDKDQWVFEAKKGETFQIIMNGIQASGKANEGYMPIAFIYGDKELSPNGRDLQTVESIQNIRTGNQFVAPENGKYMLMVSAIDRVKQGTYVIGVERVNPPSDAKSISSGVQYSGFIENPLQADNWTLKIPKGKKAKVEFVVDKNSRDTQKDFSARFDIYNESNGNYSGYIDSGSAPNYIFNSGNWVLQVRSYGFKLTGRYKLKVTIVN